MFGISGQDGMLGGVLCGVRRFYGVICDVRRFCGVCCGRDCHDCC